MSIIANRMESLDLGAVDTFKGLSMAPLLGESTGPDYLLMEEALSSQCAKVDEVSLEGSVNQLLFRNGCDKSVLLLDGEEIQGAKQNRVLNITILVPARTDLKIPVSCVEAGRWHNQGREFAPSRQMHFAEGRAAKMSQVSESMRHSSSRQADQGDVWNHIAGKMSRMQMHSPTSAMSDAFDYSEARLEEYVKAISSRSGQIGAVFAINGIVVGMECFNNAETYTKMHQKILRSYAIDALEKQGQTQDMEFTQDAARSFLQEVSKSNMEAFEALGLGRDIRISGGQVKGGALVHNDQVIHICAYMIRTVREQGQARDFSRLVRSSDRARHY